MNNPIIYLISEGNLTVENFEEKKPRFLEIIKTAVENSVSLIQIREKKLTAKLVFELTSRAAKITNHCETKLLVNDRADIALAAKADGVHLTENSILPEIIRRSFPENFIVGVSAHTLETAERAKLQGADFVTLSPVFDSPGKGAPLGLEKFSEVSKKLTPFPVIALGGIGEKNFAPVLDSGASGLAAIRFLNNRKNLKMIGREIMQSDDSK